MVRIDKIELGDFPLLLAPMEDVSDPPFRMVCKQNGADLMYTEFISSEGLIRHAQKSVMKLDIYDEERPIGIQFFGGEIDTMVGCVEIIEEAKPDLIDINYGCPVKKVACRGAGAAILQDVPKMVRMTSEIIKRATLPVTVKTRLGWDENTKNVVEVAERLQDIGIAAISIHGRTRAQLYKGNADWTLIEKVKNNQRMKIPVFCNGDIDTVEKVYFVKNSLGLDGAMIGRAAIGYPWFFREAKHFLATGEMLAPPTVSERVDVCRTHLTHSMKWKGDLLGILEMRRHYTNYFKGFPYIKHFRDRLVVLTTYEEINKVLEEIIVKYEGVTPERVLAAAYSAE